jgi:hypothetical protein
MILSGSVLDKVVVICCYLFDEQQRLGILECYFVGCLRGDKGLNEDDYRSLILDSMVTTPS